MTGPTSANDWADLIQSLLTSAGILVAALWGYFNYFKGRMYKPRLKLCIGGSFQSHAGSRFIHVACSLENTGLGRVPIEPRGTASRILRYRFNRELTGDDLETVHYLTCGVFEEHGWIEPGEVIGDEALLTISDEDWVGARLELRVVSRGIEWNSERIVFLEKGANDVATAIRE